LADEVEITARSIVQRETYTKQHDPVSRKPAAIMRIYALNLGSPQRVFAEQANAERALRIAELK
jgi:hypothetical protein